MNSPVVLSGGGLWIEFVWRGDRWGHRIGTHAETLPTSSSVVGLSEADRRGVPFGATVIFESVEGTPDETWPASPPLQELHLESRPDGKQLALLVGMAGKSHWSLSVELDPAAGSAQFDVACRVKSAVGQLGSSYARITADACLSLAASGELDSTHVVHDAVRTTIRPRDSIPTLPATVRWGYLLAAKPRFGITPGIFPSGSPS